MKTTSAQPSNAGSVLALPRKLLASTTPWALRLEARAAKVLTECHNHRGRAQRPVRDIVAPKPCKGVTPSRPDVASAKATVTGMLAVPDLVLKGTDNLSGVVCENHPGLRQLHVANSCPDRKAPPLRRKAPPLLRLQAASTLGVTPTPLPRLTEVPPRLHAASQFPRSLKPCPFEKHAPSKERNDVPEYARACLAELCHSDLTEDSNSTACLTEFLAKRRDAFELLCAVGRYATFAWHVRILQSYCQPHRPSFLYEKNSLHAEPNRSSA